MTPTQQRDRAIQLGRTDVVRGRTLASDIDDPWFRAQALAWIAWLGPDDLLTEVLRESQNSAFSCTDPYRQVAAASWPIRAAIERGRSREAAAFASAVLPVSGGIENPVSRMDALFLLWQSAIGLSREIRSRMLEQLVAAATAANSWKSGQTLRDLALMIGKDEPTAAVALVNAMPEGQFRRQAESRLAKREFLSPRVFFWQ